MHDRVAYVGFAFVLLGATLLASPTLGFETIAADRSTQVETAADADALVGFEATSEAIAGRQDTATAFYLRNNADQTLTLTTDNTLSTTDVAIVSGGSGTIAPGEATQVVLECNGGGSSGTATLTTTVLEATGNSLSVHDASASTTVDYTCSGNSNPGQGFESVSAGDVTTWTSPGDERQTFSFVPASNLQPNSQVTIDLSDAQGNSIDYMAADWPDVRVESGSGDVWYDDGSDSIIYQAAGGNQRAKAGETIEVSIGDYGTSGTAGPLQASFTRQDKGSTGTDTFYVVDDGTQPISDVSVANVPADAAPEDDVSQDFSFSIGVDMNYQDEVVIDLSEPQGDGVDYSRTLDWHEYQIQSGEGYLEPRPSEDAIVYHPAAGDDAGDQIAFSLSGFGTQSSGGPWDVPVTYETASDSDSFQIDG